MRLWVLRIRDLHLVSATSARPLPSRPPFLLTPYFLLIQQEHCRLAVHFVPFVRAGEKASWASVERCSPAASPALPTGWWPCRPMCSSRATRLVCAECWELALFTSTAWANAEQISKLAKCVQSRSPRAHVHCLCVCVCLCWCVRSARGQVPRHPARVRRAAAYGRAARALQGLHSHHVARLPRQRCTLAPPPLLSWRLLPVGRLWLHTWEKF